MLCIRLDIQGQGLLIRQVWIGCWIFRLFIRCRCMGIIQSGVLFLGILLKWHYKVYCLIMLQSITYRKDLLSTKLIITVILVSCGWGLQMLSLRRVMVLMDWPIHLLLRCGRLIWRWSFVWWMVGRLTSIIRWEMGISSLCLALHLLSSHLRCITGCCSWQLFVTVRHKLFFLQPKE